jgi:transposase, IS5 family
MATMPKQTTFLSFQQAKRTRRAEFLDTMDMVVPWSEFVAIVAPHYEPAKTGRPLTDCEVLIRCMCLAVWFGRGEELLEEDIHEMPVYRKFLGLACGDARIPDHTVMCRLRNLLEAHSLTRTMFTRINSLLGARGLILMQGQRWTPRSLTLPRALKTKTRNARRAWPRAKRDPTTASA